jgi:recombination protein RecR
MDSLRRLEEIFAHFPGIGPRQAKRFVHYLQGKSPANVAELVKLISDIKSASKECSLCHRYFIDNDNGLIKSSTKSSDKKNGIICNICANPDRDHSLLMIVSRDSDFESIEKSGAYSGLYFILGGTVPILDKEPEKKIRMKALLERVTKSGGDFNEIILSLNTTPDGDHTTELVKSALKNAFANASVQNIPKISILGRGLSTGAELEYADGETIRSALGNRR